MPADDISLLPRGNYVPTDDELEQVGPINDEWARRYGHLIHKKP
jgi:hypothetical protein